MLYYYIFDHPHWQWLYNNCSAEGLNGTLLPWDQRRHLPESVVAIPMTCIYYVFYSYRITLYTLLILLTIDYFLSWSMIFYQLIAFWSFQNCSFKRIILITTRFCLITFSQLINDHFPNLCWSLISPPHSAAIRAVRAFPVAPHARWEGPLGAVLPTAVLHLLRRYALSVAHWAGDAQSLPAGRQLLLGAHACILHVADCIRYYIASAIIFTACS